MGKGLMIIVLGGLMASTVISYQSKQTAIETTEEQTEYEEEVIAREIARSAFNVAYRMAQKAGTDVEKAVANVNGTTSSGAPNYNGIRRGEYQGGLYAAKAYLRDGQNVRIQAIGYFGDAYHTINENYHVRLLNVEEPSTLTVEFEESSGYCSAVYLQRYIPNVGQDPPTLDKKSSKSEKSPSTKSEKSSTKSEKSPSTKSEKSSTKSEKSPSTKSEKSDSNSEKSSTKSEKDQSSKSEKSSQSTKSDKSSKGSKTATLTDDEKYWVMEVEMIAPSGRNREGEDSRITPEDVVLEPDTRMNIFIAVDRDCSEEGVWEDDYDPSVYDWVHNSLEEPTENMEDLQEGAYAMIEQSDDNDQAWRLAFEDLDEFSKHQHMDIKANGYGGSWDDAAMTYGGTGWSDFDSDGFRKLREFSWKPDYNDQLIMLTVTPCGSNCN